MQASPKSLVKKLNYSYLFQGFLIAFAAVLGVYFAKIVIEEILIKSAILEESDYFLNQLEQNPAFNLPDTKNLTGFIDPQNLPDFIQQDLPLDDGFYEYENDGNPLVLYINSQPEFTLYLIYFRGQVDKLVMYYGLFPLLIVLTVLYLTLWIAYKWSHRTVSPLIQLANQVNQVNIDSNDVDSLQALRKIRANDEIQTLQNAIIGLVERVGSFVERERNFTRDASHELRSPLTVISIATDILLGNLDDKDPNLLAVKKIQKSADDMQKLIEVFLMISRENHKSLKKDHVAINDLVKEEIDRASHLANSKNIQFELQERDNFQVFGSDMVIAVLIGNLLRNAILYTQKGNITISIRQHCVTIADEGIGIQPEKIANMFQPHVRGDNTNATGYGIGLTIVKRLSDQFGWPISVQSEVGKGTAITISFAS